MSSGNEWEAQEQGHDNEVIDLILRILAAIRGSFMYFLMALGVVFIVYGAIGEAIPIVPISPELAGLMGLWGACLIIYGLIGRLVMRFIGFAT